MAKFKVGDKVRVRKELVVGRVYDDWVFSDEMEEYKCEILTIKSVDYEGYYLEETTYFWTDEMLEEVKEDKMEKSFREVIADIKEGEVWVQTNDFCVTGKISCINKEIIIDLKQARSSFGTLGKYKLQRKEYTFQEAFKAYEEGKEIENCEECRFKLIDKDKTLIIDCAGDEMEYSNKTELFSVKEIRGKWYIND